MKRKGILIIAMLVFSLFGLAQSHAQVVVKVKPVRANVVVVKKPNRPGVNYIWIEGHWKWNKKRNAYVWVDGRWAKRQGNKKWINGHWRKSKRGWIWVPGHWA